MSILLIITLFNIELLIKTDYKAIYLITIAILFILVIYLSFYVNKLKELEANIKLINKDLLEKQEELKKIAYYDYIAGLPNRNMFYKIMNEKLNTRFTNQASGSILYMDIDNFKNVNDTFGHDFGNLLLKKVAERFKSIKSIQKKDNYIFRMSGDEYIIVLNCKDEKKTEEIAIEIQNLFTEVFVILNEEIKVSISMGIVFFPKDGYTIDEILKKADLAMYKAKEVGKDGYKIYESKMKDEVENRVLLENSLRNALNKEEFILHYQPQIDLKTGRICGFESLIRWESWEHGRISPMEFIPIAEETGEIIEIGEWIIREACEFAMRIAEKYKKSIEVSVNISPVQLKRLNFVEMVKRTLKETGLDSSMLGIEVTETALMESFDDSIKKLEDLKNMGIKIYLDDFGTGYSSLNYLLRLPIHTIKIDKSFIDDMIIEKKGGKIISEIINLAHDLDLKVIAEGVEEEAQLSKLRRYNCDIVQGYIYSKALCEKGVYDLLDDRAKANY